MYFKDLTPGATYTIKETKAPNGYVCSYTKTFDAPAVGIANALNFDAPNSKPVQTTTTTNNPGGGGSSSSESSSSSSSSSTTKKTTSTSLTTTSTTSKPDTPQYFDINHNPVNPDTFNGKIVDANGKEVRGAKRGYDVLGNRRTGSGTGDDTPMWPIAVLVISAVGMAALVEMKRRKDKNDEIK